MDYLRGRLKKTSRVARIDEVRVAASPTTVLTSFIERVSLAGRGRHGKGQSLSRTRPARGSFITLHIYRHAKVW
jgi:hypothetical protein